jgi:hypothetical protein
MHDEMLLFTTYTFNKIKKRTLSKNTTNIDCVSLLI